MVLQLLGTLQAGTLSILAAGGEADVHLLSSTMSSSLNDNVVAEEGYTDTTLESTYNNGTCVSQQVYIDSGNEKKVLYLLSVGLYGRSTSGVDDSDDSSRSSCADEEEDKPLFSFDDEPWSLLPKTVMRPQSKDYVTEIVRRATLFAISPLPRPVNWPRTRQIEWLESHPIKDQADIAFLTAETLRLKQMLLRRAREQQVLPSDLAGGGGSTDASGGGNNRGGSNWRGIVPYLRLIMCFTQDNIKAAFLRRADAPSRAELDARNSEHRYVLFLLFILIILCCCEVSAHRFLSSVRPLCAHVRFRHGFILSAVA